MCESSNDIFMKIPRMLKTFYFSGKSAVIDVFFSMNCLKELSDYYEQSGDYRLAFSKIAFYMYQETEDVESASGLASKVRIRVEESPSKAW